MVTLTQKQPDTPLSLLLPAGLFLLLAGLTAWQASIRFEPPVDAAAYRPILVSVPAGTFTHRLDGDYYRNGYAVDAPRQALSMAALDIMKFPVSARDYDACVADGQCPPREPGHQPVAANDADVPATGVSHDDAVLYARWLSSHTGETYTLPDDAEWAYAAGSSFIDDALGIDPESRNPALRWLADYNREAARKASRDPSPRPLGHFGTNEKGLSDIGGNVWEWTTTCHRRVDLAGPGGAAKSDTTCGIYLVEGKHRTAISSFVRDARSGGCSVGAPPDNLGFRLVRRPGWLERARGFLHL